MCVNEYAAVFRALEEMMIVGMRTRGPCVALYMCFNPLIPYEIALGRIYWAAFIRTNLLLLESLV